MRLGAYAGVSTAAAAGCLLKAFHQRPNFYSAAVYLSQSNACLLILTNLLLVTACSFLYGLQRMLYGPLRPIEIEQLSEKAWYAVLDTLLAMPSFREDVGGWLLTMFVMLLAGKVWGWIGEGRVDILEQQPPANPRLFHARLATSLVLGVLFSLGMFKYCVDTVTADPRPGMMVIFTFEFAILVIFSTFTLLRYLLAVYEARVVKLQTQAFIEDRKNEIRAERAAAYEQQTPTDPTPASADEPIEVDENEIDVPGWEEKRRWLFWLEMATDMFKLILYVVFFTISITFNGLPMHIMRDVYMTFASFSDRIKKYLDYTKATSNMDKYPDATTEEIRGDSCIVCREEMVAWEQPVANAAAQPATAAAPTRRRDEGLRAKKLPCGHILHLRCLKAWLERQSVCPTCRRDVNVQPAAAANGQTGAAGAPGAPARPGQPPAQRPNGARIFNLGRIRVGFLRGPGDQIQNIVDQMNNVPRNAPAGAQANHQNGPNHLGLQQPYTDGNTATTGSVSRSEVPRQIQLMQMEQRILQDAQRLGVEQQQLATLRAMEAELARLRAQVPTGTSASAQQRPHVQIPGLMGTLPTFQPLQQPQMPLAQQMMPPMPQGFHGNPQHQLVNGQEGVPEGMTLPEGWSIMPLQAMQPPSVAMPAQPAVPAPAAGLEGVENVDAAASAMPSASEQQSVSSDDVGPTNGDGEPLFVPAASHAQTINASPGEVPVSGAQQVDIAVQQAAVEAHPDTVLVPEVASSTSEGSNTTSQALPQPSGDVKGSDSTPWASGDWSFNEPPAASSGSQPEPSQPQTTASTNDAATDPTPANGEEAKTYEGKGKGKAVEIEDAPDAEA